MQDIIYLCPSTPKGSCDWEGHQGDVASHFEDNHGKFFLDTNCFDISVAQDNEVHYLMTQFNETYLIQTKYSKETQVIEFKVRYLGGEVRASKIYYHVEILCGNFGFTSKSSGSGFETITSKNGVIYIDVQSIKVTCGRSFLDSLTAWVHIENEYNQYSFKSIRRRQYDNKTLESKARESFKRLSSYRTSMRKKSIDGMEYVQAINKIIQEKNKSSNEDTPEAYEKFIGDIVEEIFRDAMDEIEFKEYVIIQDDVLSTMEEHRSVVSETTHHREETNAGFVETREETHKEESFQKKIVTDIIEYKSPDDFFNSIKEQMTKSSDEGRPFFENDSSDDVQSHYFHITTNNITRYEEVHVFKSDRNINNLTIEIELPILQEDVVSSIEVATHQIANKEYLDEQDKRNSADVDDLTSCEWLLNGQATEREKEREKNKRNNRLSEAEELYYNNIDRIRCQNCHIIMIPPIFMCSVGHSVCLTCKTLNCGICGIEVTDIRNIDLEEISRTITHPCRFSEKGCTEVHSCYEIRRHEIYCDYFKYKCPYCCLQVGKYFEIKAHIRLLHPSLKIVETSTHPFGRNSEFVFANKYGIFHCVAPLKVNSIEWTVNFCGLEKISFVCRVKVTGKKGERVYTLQRHENGYKSAIFLDELKSLRLKDKHAVLHLSDY